MKKIKAIKTKNATYQYAQMYSECQLIAALNAAYKLGEPYINPHSDEYERLVDLVLARHGSAISVEKAYDYLKLKYIDVKPSVKSIKSAMEINLPIGVTVFTAENGNHSVCIVDMKGNEYLRVPNLRHYTDKFGWIKFEYLVNLIVSRKNLGPEYGYFRLFYRNPLFEKKG